MELRSRYGGDHVLPISGDLSDERHIETAIEETVAHWSALDCVVDGIVRPGVHPGRPRAAVPRRRTGLGYALVDCGTHSTDPVDYPDLAYAVARLVSSGAAWRGIVVDGAGIGSAMAANKVPGVRALYDRHPNPRTEFLQSVDVDRKSKRFASCSQERRRRDLEAVMLHGLEGEDCALSP